MRYTDVQEINNLMPILSTNDLKVITRGVPIFQGSLPGLGGHPKDKRHNMLRGACSTRAEPIFQGNLPRDSNLITVHPR